MSVVVRCVAFVVCGVFCDGSRVCSVLFDIVVWSVLCVVCPVSCCELHVERCLSFVVCCMLCVVCGVAFGVCCVRLCGADCDVLLCDVVCCVLLLRVVCVCVVA